MTEREARLATILGRWKVRAGGRDPDACNPAWVEGHGVLRTIDDLANWIASHGQVDHLEPSGDTDLPWRLHVWFDEFMDGEFLASTIRAAFEDAVLGIADRLPDGTL